MKYHLGSEGTFTAPSGKTCEVYLAANPSHLEAVDPVVAGMARARQSMSGPDSHHRILPILLHGDAAFAGQVAGKWGQPVVRADDERCRTRRGDTQHVVGREGAPLDRPVTHARPEGCVSGPRLT